MRIRMHRGSLSESISLSESMETMKEIDGTLQSICDYLNSFPTPTFPHPVTEDRIRVVFYAYDNRITWNTHIVCVDGYIAAFSNEPVAESDDQHQE